MYEYLKLSANYPLCKHKEYAQSNNVIQLYISPYCNVKCFFCRGSQHPVLSDNIQYPNIQNLEEALNEIESFIHTNKQLHTIFISGPGEPLASNHALDIIEKIHELYPSIPIRLHTNGLLLEENVENLLSIGVTEVLVSINSFNPASLMILNKGITFNGRFYFGQAGAEKLISNQMIGISKAVKMGLRVTVETLLIPGVNDVEISKIADISSRIGVSMIQISPFVSHFKIKKFAIPTSDQLANAIVDASKFIKVSNYLVESTSDILQFTNV